jgi:hypothetical protein
LEGYVSPAQAVSIYGVVIAGDGNLDVDATAARRAELASMAPQPPALLPVDDEHLRLAQSLARLVEPPG